MLNLISSDIYKLRKARYFWICMILNILLAAGSIFALDFAFKASGGQIAAQMEQQQETLNASGVNVSAEGVTEGLQELDASSKLTSFFAGNNTIILAVLIALFIGSEFNNGTIKNMASKNYSRSKIYSSKLVVGIVTGIIFTLIYAAVSTATATALWGFGDTGSGFCTAFLLSAAIELLLLSSFISIFVMFSMLIRQNGGSLAANICFLQFTSLAVMLGEMIIKKLFDKSISLSGYLIDTNMLALCNDLDSTIIIRSLCVAAAFFLAASIIGLSNFKTRDIR